MGDPLDLLHLRTLVAIADCGGFGRAAAALFISQPTVSQHVRNLEKRVGAPLVEKSGRTTRLTPAGESLLAEARRILAVHDEAIDRIDALERPQIVIGSTETAADQLLPRMLTTVRDAYPGHQVRFHIDRSTQLIERLGKGSIDIAVLLATTPEPGGAEVGVLPLNWFSAPGWEPPAAPAAWPLVAYVEPCGMRRRALQRLGLSGHLVEVAAESTSLDGVIAAARAGLGVAVLPTSGAAPEGLVRRDDLPVLGDISVQLMTKTGLSFEIEQIAYSALNAFFDDVRSSATPA